MTPTQTWLAVTELLTKLYPACIVKRMYSPVDDLENIAYSDQPNIWVTLNSLQLGAVNTMASYVEDSYEFRLTLIWKIKDSNMIELDKRLDMTQDIITRLSYTHVAVDNSEMFFKNPSIETVYDLDAFNSDDCYVSTVLLPVSVYRTIRKN